MNRDVQLELFGDFVSDDESSHNESIEFKRKKNSSPSISLLASNTAASLAPQHRISPPPHPPILPLPKTEKDKQRLVKTLNKPEKHIMLPHKENACVVQNNEGNSPRIVIRVSRPPSYASAAATPPPRNFLASDNSTNVKDKKEKKKKKEKV